MAALSTMSSGTMHGDRGRAGWLLRSPWTSAAAALTAVLAAAPVSAERLHRFDGFGVNLWPDSKDVVARDALMHDLHVRMVRTGLQQCTPLGSLKRVPGQTDFASITEHCAHQQLSKVESDFKLELAALGIQLHLVYWTMPEPWRLGDNRIRQADPAHLQDMANWLTVETRHAVDAGFDISGVELANEPNGVWNTQYTPEQYAELVILTRSAFNAAVLQALHIEGPGTSNDTSNRYMTASAPLLSDNDLTMVSIHEYDSRRVAEPAGLTLTKPVLDGLRIMAPIYVTEFGTSNLRWQQPPYVTGADRDSAEFAGNSRDFAVSAVGEAIGLLADGASAIFYWDLEDVDWAPRNLGSGLLASGGRRRPVADAFVVALEGLRPGAMVTRIETGQLSSVALSSRDSEGETIILVNLGSKNMPVNLAAGQPGCKLRQSSHYSALSEVGLNLPHVDLVGVHLVGSVPARSIVTLLLSPPN